MEQLKTIILVEDKANWSQLIEEMLKKGLSIAVNIEVYRSFDEGENRILALEKPIDLLIADIYGAKSKEPRGIAFAKFVKNKRNKPVIIITAERSQVKSSILNPDVDDAFYKIGFNKLEFLESVENLLNKDSNSLHNLTIPKEIVIPEVVKKDEEGSIEPRKDQKGTGTVF